MLFLRVLAALAAIHCPLPRKQLRACRATAVTSAEFATNLTLPRKAPNLGPFKSIKVVEPSTIYLKDGSGATLVELDVELKVD